MARQLNKMQVENLESYLDKSGDYMEQFMDKFPSSKTIEVDGMGWLEYSLEIDEDGDTVFFIHTAFSKKEHKETKIVWEKVKQLAIDNECTKIYFLTYRNPKAFKRLFNAYPVEYKMRVDLTKEL